MAAALLLRSLPPHPSLPFKGLSELLDVYRATVLHVQQALLAQPALVLSAVKYALADFSVLLPHLHQLAYTLHGARRGGAGSAGAAAARLLDALQRDTACGVPLIESCASRLLWHCHQVLFRQLAAWMAHGLLLDPHREFFVGLLDEEEAAEAAVLGAGSHERPAAAAAGGGRLQQPGASVAAAPSQDDWHRGHTVRLHALPRCISEEAADKVLFVGKAVRVLSAPGGAFAGSQLLPASDVADIADQLRALQQEPVFSKVAFERVVEGVRSRVAAMLWQLLVVRAGLVSHLAAMKDFYLLARGDFYDAFLGEADRLLRLPPRPATADADVAVPFAAAAAKTSASADPLLPLLRLRWRPVEDAPELRLGKMRVEVPRADPGWDGLYLEYKVSASQRKKEGRALHRHRRGLLQRVVILNKSCVVAAPRRVSLTALLTNDVGRL